MNAIIMYATFSGNTEEVAELIHETLTNNGHNAELFEITGQSIPVDLSPYDVIFFGTFTWDMGSTPDFVKDFIADIGYKPDNVVAFGTGDTQFGGDELFCNAAKKISRFYHSEIEPLLIEQSPRGSQEEIVITWTEEVIKSSIVTV